MYAEETVNNRLDLTTVAMLVSTKHKGWVSVPQKVSLKKLRSGGEVKLLLNVLFIAGAVKIAGIVSLLNALALACFCVLSVIQLSMIVSKDKVVVKYTTAVTAKLCLALLASEWFNKQIYVLLKLHSSSKYV